MANAEHVTMLRTGAEVWAAWRQRHPALVPDLARADLAGLDLRGFDLAGADLVEADLHGANLLRAGLVRANLLRANLCGAMLAGADLTAAVLGWARLRGANLWMAGLTGANLIKADLTGAHLGRANLSGAVLAGAVLRQARLGDTVLADADLRSAGHLVACVHDGPSALDYRTLQRSGPLPLSFLRGCGLPDALIDCLPSIVEISSALPACLIRHHPSDRALADRLFADLQHEGVRCWRSSQARPEPRTVARTLRDGGRVVAVLSRHSLAGGWIAGEVGEALAAERRTRRPSLVALRADDEVVRTRDPWSVDLRTGRTIEDFSSWRDPRSYRRALGRLLGAIQATELAARSRRSWPRRAPAAWRAPAAQTA